MVQLPPRGKQHGEPQRQSQPEAPLEKGRERQPVRQEPDLSHPHNYVLDHLVRLGVFGLAVGIWIQAIFWRMALPLRKLRDRDRRALALGLMGSMADLLAHGLVDHSFFLIDLAFAFCLTLALTKALSEDLL